MNHDELIGAVAMSLYKYNVPYQRRAMRLHDAVEDHKCDIHKRGGYPCSEYNHYCDMVDHDNWATEMTTRTASAYMQHAMEEYGYEAKERVLRELGE